MKYLLALISAFALAATIVPSVQFVMGTAELPWVKTAMLLATVVWFAVTPLWMRRPSPE